MRVVTSLKRRVRDDFNLDEATAARLALGLGDESMPALSVFGPPVIDFGAAAGPAHQRRGGRGAASQWAFAAVAAGGLQHAVDPLGRSSRPDQKHPHHHQQQGQQPAQRQWPSDSSGVGPEASGASILPAQMFLRATPAAGGINPVARAISVEGGSPRVRARQALSLYARGAAPGFGGRRAHAPLAECDYSLLRLHTHAMPSPPA
jgi:hypothetical protein